MSAAKIRTCALRSGRPVSAANTCPRSVDVPGGGVGVLRGSAGASICAAALAAATNCSRTTIAASVCFIPAYLRASEHQVWRQRQIDGLVLAGGEGEPGRTIAG